MKSTTRDFHPNLTQPLISFFIGSHRESLNEISYLLLPLPLSSSLFHFKFYTILFYYLPYFRFVSNNHICYQLLFTFFSIKKVSCRPSFRSNSMRFTVIPSFYRRQWGKHDGDTFLFRAIGVLVLGVTLIISENIQRIFTLMQMKLVEFISNALDLRQA